MVAVAQTTTVKATLAARINAATDWLGERDLLDCAKSLEIPSTGKSKVSFSSEDAPRVRKALAGQTAKRTMGYATWHFTVTVDDMECSWCEREDKDEQEVLL